jgi:Ca2+-binding EF-hand superfamily protein
MVNFISFFFSLNITNLLFEDVDPSNTGSVDYDQFLEISKYNNKF